MSNILSDEDAHPEGRKLVYISGKYTGRTREEIAANIAVARSAAIAVWEARHFALCPHLNTAHFEEDCTARYDDYLAGDLRMIDGCDGILMLDNWRESAGAQRELAHAVELNKPNFRIYYGIGMFLAMEGERPSQLPQGVRRIIGIAGKKGAGKTLLASQIISFLLDAGWHVAHINFSDPLKQEVAELLSPHLGQPASELIDEMNDPATKENYRALMQVWGTDVKRNMVNSAYWLDAYAEAAHAFFSRTPATADACVLVSDVRFQNEAEYVRSEGGIMIEVVRPVPAGQGGTPAAATETHLSETSLADYSGYSAQVINDGAFSDLSSDAQVLARLIVTGKWDAASRPEDGLPQDDLPEYGLSG